MTDWTTKKLIVFDLDGTLTKSKAALDFEMSGLLCPLLDQKIVAVTSGGSYQQFRIQFLNCLECNSQQLERLFIMPVSGGSLHRYQGGRWSLVYHNFFTDEEKAEIRQAFEKVFVELPYATPAQTFGTVIEDRGSQVTFSALGQEAPLAAKQDWHDHQDVRPQLQELLQAHLPQFGIRLGGLTSIDVTKKGIDKAYGVEQLAKLLEVTIADMVYVGDALYQGGNDYPVVRTGIETVQVQDEEQTKSLIRKILT